MAFKKYVRNTSFYIFILRTLLSSDDISREKLRFATLRAHGVWTPWALIKCYKNRSQKKDNRKLPQNKWWNYLWLHFVYTNAYWQNSLTSPLFHFYLLLRTYGYRFSTNEKMSTIIHICTYAYTVRYDTLFCSENWYKMADEGGPASAFPIVAFPPRFWEHC